MSGYFNKNLYIFVVSFSTAFSSLIPLYADHLKENNFDKENDSKTSIFEPMSRGFIPETDNLIKFKIANNKENIRLIISNVGEYSTFFKKTEKQRIKIEITTQSKKSILKNEQNLSIPSAGILNA